MTAYEPAPFTVHLPITFRFATKHDLRRLEWFGEYTHFRNLIRRAYREQMQGRRLMLLADCHGYPVGQVFIQLASRDSRIADGSSRGYLYAFRVQAMFRGQGIGTRLLHEAEALLSERGYSWTTLSVAKDNEAALRLYQRQSYHIIGEDSGHWSYVDHRGVTQHMHEPAWVMEKRLAPLEFLR